MVRQHRVCRRQWNSERIRTLRRHLGLTQRHMADMLGKRQQGISKWERGVSKPHGTSATLIRIIAERANFDREATSSKGTT